MTDTITIGYYATTPDSKFECEIAERFDPTFCSDLAELANFDIAILRCCDTFTADVIRQLRVISPVPVIALNGNVSPRQFREILMAGADDLMRLPLYLDELEARIRAVVRRCRRKTFTSVTAGNITIAFESKTVEVDGKRVSLSRCEFAILQLLSLRKGSRVSKDAIFNFIYEGRDEPEPKIVDVFVCKLRKKLERAGANPDHIETVWGFGYQLVDEPSPRTRSRSLRSRVLDVLNGVPKSAQAISDETGSNYKSVNPVLNTLHADGMVRRSGSRPYVYNLNSNVTFNGEVV